MTARDRWVDEGLSVLAEGGHGALSIDGLATRLGLTKGSFHHHFAGIAGFRTALLERYRSDAERGLEATATLLEGRPPLEALQAFPELLGEMDLRLETAVRAWAVSDPTARETQERIDASRLDALVAVWSGIVDDPARARTAALLPTLVLRGATVATPPTSLRDLTAVMRLLAELAPHV